MNVVKYLNPEGVEVSVPEDDAAHFDAIGWERVEDASPSKKPKK